MIDICATDKCQRIYLLSAAASSQTHANQAQCHQGVSGWLRHWRGNDGGSDRAEVGHGRQSALTQGQQTQSLHEGVAEIEVVNVPGPDTVVAPVMLAMSHR